MANAHFPGLMARARRALRRHLDAWVQCACQECYCRKQVQTRDICSKCAAGEHRYRLQAQRG